MRICAVVGCQNKGAHTFPTDETTRNRWIKATRVDVHRKIGWNLRKYSSICSDHFIPSDFVTRGKLRVLNKTAVPTIFPWTTIPWFPSDTFEVPEEYFTHTDDLKPEIDDLKLDPAKVIKTYSKRVRPFVFVEEYPSLTFETTGENIDPLQVYNESDIKCPKKTLKLDNISPLPDDRGAEGISESFIEDKDSTPAFHEHTDLKPKCDDCHHHGKSEIVHHICESISDTDNSPFSVFRYKNFDKAIQFYTGLQSFSKLSDAFHTLNCSNLKYVYEHPPKLESLEQFFMTLIILKQHKEFEEIAMLYLISVKQVTNIFITWIRHMALQWRNLDLPIDREMITSYIPLDFHDKYPTTRVILDATKCPIKKLSVPLTQRRTFSSYKNSYTIKFIIGIASTGLITFISPAYGSSVTDKQLIERSSILNRFSYDNKIMVDKGLDIQDIFMPYGVKVKMPTFFKKSNQINRETLTNSRKVVSNRVHVEKVIGMLNTYKILREPMNETETMLSSDIAFICATLVNFRSKIVKTNKMIN